MTEYEICKVPTYKVNYENSKKITKPINALCEYLQQDFQAHERLNKDDMLKLSVDIDKLKLHNPTANFDTIVADICKYVKVEACDISYTTNYGVESGSHHIVIPKFCMKSSEQKAFWKRFRDTFSYGKEVDADIFDKSGWFRLPNQTKEGVAGTEHIVQTGKLEDFVLKYVENSEPYPFVSPIIIPMTTEKSKKTPIESVVDDEEDTDKESDIEPTEDRFVDLLNVIGNKLEWNDWFKVAGALKYNSYSFETFDNFSKKSKLYNKRTTEQLWADIKNQTKHISIHTLQNIAKQENSVAYKSWLLKWCEVDLITPLFTTGLIADYFSALYKTQFIFNDDKLYYWNGYIWICDDKRYSFLTNFVDKEFIKDLRDYGNRKLVGAEDEDRRKKIAEYIKNVAGVRKNGFRKGLIDDIIYKITNNDIAFNTKNYLFAFNNSVYDLLLGKIVKPDPEDYISISCGYDYETEKPEKMKDLTDIIDTMFPDATVKDHYLEILATGLCGLQMEKCCVATGCGGNGKSLINSLMLKTCGKYGYKLPSSLLLKEIKQGANPEVANLDCVRFALLQEPDRNKKINASTLKELTGDKTLNVRGLYSNKCNIQLKQTTILEANDLPKLDEVNPALSRRMDITPFVSRAVSQEDYDCAENKAGLIVANPYYKTDEFQEQYKCVLFHLLLPYFKSFQDRKFVLSNPPEAVKRENSKYLASSDTLYEWFITEYEECEGEFIAVKDIHAKWNANITATATMSRRTKEKFSSKGKLEEELTKNLFLSKYLKSRDSHYCKNKLKTTCICGWKQKEQEEIEAIEEI